MLIIAEKEKVALNYIKALKLKKIETSLYANEEKTIKVTYAAGHLYTLYDAEDYDEKNKIWKTENLPIIPHRYLYKPIKEKAQFRKACENAIRNAIKGNEEIVIATDPDREGEVIARLILNACKADYKKVTRIWMNEGLSEEEILKAIKERKSVSYYQDLYLQGKAQKESDWVMGINLTRSYSILNKEIYSVGRVQTAVLKEIYNRYIQILMFIPKEYYEVQVQLANGTFAFLINETTNSKKFDTLKEAEEKVKKINQQEKVKVTKKIVKTEVKKSPRLYDLAGLEMDGYNIYGIEIDRVLELAQQLYNEKGVLSYPRANSVCLGEEDVEDTIKLYEKLKEHDNRFETSKKKLNKDNKRLFNDKEKGSHHGLIPTQWYAKNDSEDWKIYDLVLRRFFMQTMKDLVEEKISIIFNCGSEILKAEGKTTIEKGWKEADLRKTEKEIELPKMEEGKEFRIKEVKIEKKYTQKPKYYNEATILEYMRNPKGENKEGIELISIGTEATQATIIKVLFKRGYVKTVNKHIEITEKGIKIVEQIKNNKVLDQNTNTESTAKWEILGKENPEKLLKEIEEVTKKSVENLRNEMKAVVEKKVIAKCPCGGDIIDGKNYYCSNYKEGCKNSVSKHIMGKEYSAEDVKKLFEEGKLDYTEGISKDGNKVKYRLLIQDGKVTIEFDSNNVILCKCPKCQGNVYEYKKVYKCSNKECDFFMWKETSGIVIEKEMVEKLVNGETIENITKKYKDGKEEKVSIRYNKEEDVISIIR